MRLAGSLSRIGEMIRKELIQVLRDRRLRGMLIAAPIGQLIIFGYAVSTDVRDTKLAVLDHDNTLVSRELVQAFTQSGYFRVVARPESPREMVGLLDHGRTVVGLEIPAGFAASIGRREPAEVQILVDGTNSNLALVAKGYAERIVLEYGLRGAEPADVAGSAGIAGEISASHASPNAGIDLRERAWYNPGLKSRIYNVPAVAGVIIMLVCLLLTSLAVVREREIGTLEQLMVSPLRPLELIAGKTIPFALLGLLDLFLVTTVAVLWFRIPFEGSFFLLLGASVLYLLSGLGLGLLVSTVSRTQQEAFMASFLIFMPMVLLSGFMFPVSSMPGILQWLTLLNPLRHFLHILRAVFLKGTGLAILWPQVLGLLLLGVSILGFAATRFRKTVG